MGGTESHPGQQFLADTGFILPHIQHYISAVLLLQVVLQSTIVDHGSTTRVYQ